MAKQKATITDKKLATKVEGHEIQKPRLLDADHDRELSQREHAVATAAPAPDALPDSDTAPISTKKSEDKD